MPRKSVMEIFNELDYEEKNLFGDNSGIFKNTETAKEYKQLFKCLEDVSLSDEVIVTAVEAQKAWGASSLQVRTDALHEIWKHLNILTESLREPEEEISLFINYFDFYCDILPEIEEKREVERQGVVKIDLLDNAPVFAAAATIPAALGAGCSVIVIARGAQHKLCLYLERLFLKASLPKGIFQAVTVSGDKENLPEDIKINKVFVCGSYSSVKESLSESVIGSLNFFCPNNTAAFVLESADLNAAAGKIIDETWNKERPAFAVSTVVVQESIYLEFLDKLKCRMNQFMTENKYSLNFRGTNKSQEIQEIIFKAIKAGASVEEVKSCGDWNPTVLIDYHEQDIDPNAPVLKLLVCRTAKEGVDLLNNSGCTLGISVWSEISSQALEISSELIIPNIWVNCHGAFDASVPLQLSDSSGNCALGGNDGILEFISFGLNNEQLQIAINSEDALPKKNSYDDEIDKFIKEIEEKIISAQQAFKTWRQNKSKRQYLKQIANLLSTNSETEHLTDIIHYYARSRYLVSFPDESSNEEFCFVRTKIPLGVILIIINTEIAEARSVVSLVTPALALGNAAVVIFTKKDELLQSIMETYKKILPKNVLDVSVGVLEGFSSAPHSDIKTIWLNDGELFRSIVTVINWFSRDLKKAWLAPEKAAVCQELFQRECLQNKTVWFTKMDQFP